MTVPLDPSEADSVAAALARWFRPEAALHADMLLMWANEEGCAGCENHFSLLAGVGILLVRRATTESEFVGRERRLSEARIDGRVYRGADTAVKASAWGVLKQAR